MSKTKPTQKKSEPVSNKLSFKQWLLKRKIWIIIIIIVLILIDTFITGYVKFAYNVVRCGGMPVSAYSDTVVGLSYGGTEYYGVPGDSSYRVNAAVTYFCGRDDAERNGSEAFPLSEYGQRRQQELKNQDD